MYDVKIKNEGYVFNLELITNITPIDEPFKTRIEGHIVKEIPFDIRDIKFINRQTFGNSKGEIFIDVCIGLYNSYIRMSVDRKEIENKSDNLYINLIEIFNHFTHNGILKPVIILNNDGAVIREDKDKFSPRREL